MSMQQHRRSSHWHALLLVLFVLSLSSVGGEEGGGPGCINDGEPPQIDGLEISDTILDVRYEASNVTVKLNVSDAGSPIERCSLSLRSSDRLNPQFVVFSGSKNCTESGLSCVLHLTAWVRPHLIPGEWSLEVSCRDTPCVAGGPRNTFVYAGRQLTGMGLPGTVEILSEDPDITPPEVLSLEFKPEVVDVSEGNATVTALLLISDDISGIESCLVTLRSPSVNVRATLDGTAQCSDDRRKCGYTVSAVLPASAPPGLWMPSVFCRDSVQNRMLRTATQLVNQGITGVQVETEMPDSAPPRLLQFSLSPPMVNVASKSAEVDTSMVVLDLDSPLADCTLIFHGPDGRQVAVGDALPSSCTEDYKRCTYKKRVEIPKGSAAGSWKPTLVCSDVLQNRDVFGSARLQDLGFTAVLHVEDSVDDSRAPVLTALDLSADTVDAGLATAPVGIQLKVTDGLSSLDGCIAILHGPSRQSLSLSADTETTSCQEESRQCTYGFKGEIPQGSQEGRWEISTACRDTSGNGFAHWADDLEELGFKSSVLVEASSAPEDDGTPVLEYLTFFATTELPIDGPREVQVQVIVSDAQSRVDGCTVVFMHNSLEIVFARLVREECASDGSECIYLMSAELPAVPGVWPVAVSCKDAAGNHATHRQAWLEEKGLPGKVTVVSKTTS